MAWNERGRVARTAITLIVSGALVLGFVPAPALAEAAGEATGSGAAVREVPANGETDSGGEASDPAPAAPAASATAAAAAGSAAGGEAAPTTSSPAPSAVAASAADAPKSGVATQPDAAVPSTAPSATAQSDDDADAVAIYTTLLRNAATGSSGYVYTSGDTVEVVARERGASTTDFIDPQKLTYQWQSTKTGQSARDFADIPGATEPSLSLAGHVGEYVRCVVSAKVGGSSRTTRATMKIASAGSVNVTSVSVTPETIAPGTTLTATAKSGSDDVTASPSLTWKWYLCDSSSDGGSPIEGATSSTLTVPSDESWAGKYVMAAADGGYGEEKSSAEGPVKVPGAVELHHVEVTGDAKIGSTLAATAYVSSYQQVDATARVSYQWEYASSNSTSDSAFQPIPGATGRTLALEDEVGGIRLQGKYLRVRATSDGSVVSTLVRGSYYDRSVDPVGPVTLAGQYDLASVDVESSGQGAQDGATLTARPQVQGSWGETDAPSDAKLAYTWYASPDGSAENARVVGTAATLDLTGLAGSYVWVKAEALGTPATSTHFHVLGAHEYDLLRVTTSPQINSSTTTLFTGDAVTATIYARRLTSSSYGDDVTDREGVSIQWYSGDSAKGPWTPLNGATSSKLAIPKEAAGKYLRCVATSGGTSGEAGSSVELTSATAVVDSTTVEGALARLDSEGWVPTPRYGSDTNVNEVLAAKLRQMGFQDVTVSTTSATRNGSAPIKARVGVSTEDATNGDVTYFYMDPDDYTGWYANYTSWRQVDVSFRVSAGGETCEWTPKRSVSLDFDRAAYEDLLNQRAASLEPGFAEGDTSSSVTEDLTLPYKLKQENGSTSSWSSVSWASDQEDAISVDGYGWYSDYTGKVTRGSADREVTLTAAVSLSSSDLPSDLSVTRDFHVTVKADPQKVERERAELEQKLQSGFSYQNVKDFSTGDAVNHDAVRADLQMPTTRTLKVDGKYYQVSYSSDSKAIGFNGYHAEVVQPLGTDATVNVTCTVTSKENPEVTASKTLLFTVRALDVGDVDAELDLLHRVEAGYKDALLDGKTEPLASNLSTFRSAYLDGSGSLVFARSSAEADGHAGIALVDISGGDEKAAYNFKSDRTGVIASDTLLLTQPTYNTKVTVSSRLRSERFGAYYEKYRDDPSVDATLLDKLRELAGADVEATFDVAGTTGKDDPNVGEPGTDEPSRESVTATVRMVGPDAKGGSISWVPLTELTVPSGTTAAKLTREALGRYGLTCDEGMYTVSATDGARLPNGQEALGYSQDSSGAWSWWQFYVNGKLSSEYASSYVIQPGDRIEWLFGKDDSDFPAADVTVDPTARRPSYDSEWPGYKGEGEQGVSTAPTATGGSALAWRQSLTGSSTMTFMSDPILVNGDVYVATGSTLQVRDAKTGKVKHQASLAARVESTCRLVYADGVVVVPLHGGRLQALTADALTTVWLTDALPDSTAADGTSVAQQPISTLTVRDGCVYLGTAAATFNGSTAGGWLECVDLANGAVRWRSENDSTGYYWSGFASVDGGMLVADDAGTVSLVDPSTGRVASTLDLGTSCRAGVVASRDGRTAYVVTRDGVLHKLSVTDDKISEEGSVRFASYSTSTPTLVDGTLYVGGRVGDDQGGIFVVDAKTLRLVSSATTLSAGRGAKGEALRGEVKSAPLVVTRGGNAYVYFTCNGPDGGLYRYRVGDAGATLLYLPEKDFRQYSISSVVAASDGSLYYTNDSGSLFKIGSGAELPSQSYSTTDNRRGTDISKQGGNGQSDTPRQVAYQSGHSLAARLARASRTTVRIRRSATATTVLGDPLGLLSQEDSSTLIAKSEAKAESGRSGSGKDIATSEGDKSARSVGELPIWPIVGMCVGALALVGAAVRRDPKSDGSKSDGEA